MIIRTLQTLKAFNTRGEIIEVPEGTYVSLTHDKADLLINLGKAEMVDLDKLCARKTKRKARREDTKGPERLPYFNKQGDLVIPSQNPRYHLGNGTVH